MRIGSRSNKLLLVDSSEHEIREDADVEGLAVEYSVPPDAADDGDPSDERARGILVFVLVSAACAAAAIAAGSYALWLSRRSAAQQAITDVQNILQTCQSRMSRLEDDLKKLS